MTDTLFTAAIGFMVGLIVGFVIGLTAGSSNSVDACVKYHEKLSVVEANKICKAIMKGQS
jgi:ABC-type nitrate/sulfonate/bicarbonate transport system permease component